MAQLMRTSNPALNDNVFRSEGVAFGEAMTVQGTVNKTGILLICAMATAAWSWNRFLSAPEQAAPMVDIFLQTEFLGGRHSRRVAKIAKIESYADLHGKETVE